MSYAKDDCSHLNSNAKRLKNSICRSNVQNGKPESGGCVAPNLISCWWLITFVIITIWCGMRAKFTLADWK